MSDYNRRARVAQDVRIEEEGKLTSRRSRSPQHTWIVKMQPWQIVPCGIAPVLPGESLKNAMFQARIVSDPIRNKVTGWWCEWYLWYVRVGDLDNADVIRAAVIDPANNMNSIAAAGPSSQYYHAAVAAANKPLFSADCMKVCVERYFRDQGEAHNNFTIGGFPVASVTGNSVLDSLTRASDLGTITGADDWEKSWYVYQQLRRAQLTTNTFEEYLAKNGVQAPPILKEITADFRIPELIRFVRDFAQPNPTVNPTDGKLVAQVQWSMAERVSKRRFFDQPGFLFWVMVVRPKTYFRNMRTALADIIMDDAAGWLPAEYDTDPHTSLDKAAANDTIVSSGAGPIHGATVETWYDRRDLLLYGDQWTNINHGSDTVWGAYHMVDLPKTDASNLKYPDSVAAAEVFASGTETNITCDGILQFNIASRINKDTTA